MVERLRGARACPASRRGRSTPTRSASSATSGRSGTTARRCRRSSTRSCRSSAGSRAGCPATTGSRRPRTSPTRSSGRRAARITPRGVRGGAAAADRDAADSRRPVRARLRRLRAGEDAGRPDRLRRHADADGRPARGATPRRPRSSAPASAGSASTSTRTRTRSSSGCSSCGWAIGRDVCVVGDEDQTIYTFTGATSAFLTAFAERHAGARGRRADRELPLHARRCWSSPTG